MERIPCMCCEAKNNNNSSTSFDKSFNSKEEGKELLCSASDANLLIHSLSLDEGDEEIMAEGTATEMSVLVEPNKNKLAELVLGDDLNQISSLETGHQETSLLLNHSEPILSLCPSNRSTHQTRPHSRSKSLSFTWFGRLPSFSLPQMWKHS